MADRRTRIDLTFQFEFLYGSERHTEFQIRPKCFSDENKVRVVIDLKYSDGQMQLVPIMKTLRFYCISMQQSMREASLPFSVKVSDKISRVRLKSSAFQNQATSNIQDSYDGVWLQDTLVHKFLLPELHKHRRILGKTRREKAWRRHVERRNHFALLVMIFSRTLSGRFYPTKRSFMLLATKLS